MISLALEDKKWFDFCLDILSVWLCLKTLMLHDMTHEKKQLSKNIMFSVRLLLIKRDVHFI